MRNLSLGAACAALAAAALAQASPAGASPPGGYQVKGYAGKCADDAGNSTALRAHVQVWSCTGGAAQQWSFSYGELRHGGLCMNAKGGARNGAPVILWTCDNAANENWVYSTVGGRYFLRASGLCLDDPGFSTRNGTQLVVWRCNGGVNQRWSPPPGLTPGTQTLLDVSGSGSTSTARYKVGGSGDYDIHWSYNEGSFGQPVNFAFVGDGGSDFKVTDPNQLGAGGSGVVHVYGDTGLHYLEVISEGDWTVKVVTAP